VGISFNGVVTFTPHLYGGYISDKALTANCGLIEFLEVGDVVMADKGFDNTRLASCKEGYFKHSSIFKGKGAVVSCRRGCVTFVRIHVERAIERIKNYCILQGLVPLSMSNWWFICCMLTNFLPALVE